MTRPSVVEALEAADLNDGTPALETLLGIYWKPVYQYLRVARRMSHEDAEDLTQDFFSRALERNIFSRFDGSRAGLPTFLRVCLDHFVVSAHRAATRQKRGGRLVRASLDGLTIEHEVALGWDPEVAFRREWIRGLFEESLAAVQAHCERHDKAIPMAVFQAVDIDPRGDVDRPSYQTLARRFAISVTQVTNYLAYVRRVFRRAVLDRIRAASGSDADYAAEAREVLGVEVE